MEIPCVVITTSYPGIRSARASPKNCLQPMKNSITNSLQIRYQIRRYPPRQRSTTPSLVSRSDEAHRVLSSFSKAEFRRWPLRTFHHMFEALHEMHFLLSVPIRLYGPVLIGPNIVALFFLSCLEGMANLWR
ncbi:hypothetical protein HanRHA438_Chr17g0808241 [Helianthus annuus]|nr:hypothetical protein HanRHA438_Chr17g0808241 [Helianthus annuus]